MRRLTHEWRIVMSLNEVTLLLNTNKPHNPYIRLHMILDMLENVPKDYVIDKVWIGRELQEIFDMFVSVAEEKYNEPISN